MSTGRVVVGRIVVAYTASIEKCSSAVDSVAVSLTGGDASTSTNALPAVIDKRGAAWLTVAVTRKLTGGSTDADIASVEIRRTTKSSGAVHRTSRSSGGTANAALTAVDKRIASLDECTIAWLYPSCTFDTCPADVTERRSVGYAGAICAAGTVAAANIADISNGSAAPNAVAVPGTGRVVIQRIAVTDAAVIEDARAPPHSDAVLSARGVVVGSVFIADSTVIYVIGPIGNPSAIEGAIKARREDRVVVAWVIVTHATSVHYRTTEELAGAVHRARCAVGIEEVIVAWVVVTDTAGIFGRVSTENIVAVSLTRLKASQSTDALVACIEIGSAFARGVLVPITVDDTGGKTSQASNTFSAFVHESRFV